MGHTKTPTAVWGDTDQGSQASATSDPSSVTRERVAEVAPGAPHGIASTPRYQRSPGTRPSTDPPPSPIYLSLPSVGLDLRTRDSSPTHPRRESPPTRSHRTRDGGGLPSIDVYLSLSKVAPPHRADESGLDTLVPGETHVKRVVYKPDRTPRVESDDDESPLLPAAGLHETFVTLWVSGRTYEWWQ